MIKKVIYFFLNSILNIMPTMMNKNSDATSNSNSSDTHLIESDVCITPSKNATQSSSNPSVSPRTKSNSTSNVSNDVKVLSPPSAIKPLSRLPSKKRKQVTAIECRKTKHNKKEIVSNQSTITSFIKKSSSIAKSNKHVSASNNSTPLCAIREKFIISLPDKNNTKHSTSSNVHSTCMLN